MNIDLKTLSGIEKLSFLINPNYKEEIEFKQLNL